MPVIRFVAPGPLVARATAVTPETRVYPSAANAHACSCFTETSVKSGSRKIASSKCVIIHPDRLNICVTPFDFKNEMM